jgi:predicted DNA binding CopG/RHH family protein
MKKEENERINLWVSKSLYNQIKGNADKSYLRVATYVRQLICNALKNNIIKN